MSRVRTPEDLDLAKSRLPKWAQQLIWRLDRDIEYLQGKIRQIGQEDESHVHYQVGSGDETGGFLPDCTTIEFFLPKGSLRIDLNREKNLVEVHASAKGLAELYIRPRYANEFEILVEDLMI